MFYLKVVEWYLREDTVLQQTSQWGWAKFRFICPLVFCSNIIVWCVLSYCSFNNIIFVIFIYLYLDSDAVRADQFIYLFVCLLQEYSLSLAHVIIFTCLWIATQMYIYTPENINPSLPPSVYTCDIIGLYFQIQLNRHHYMNSQSTGNQKNGNTQVIEFVCMNKGRTQDLLTKCSWKTWKSA